MTSFWPLKLLLFLKKEYIKKKKKEERKKERRKSWPKMGLSGHPIFGKGVATTPFLAKGWLEPVWGWSNHPHGQGDGLATLKRQKKKKRGFWAFGGGQGHGVASSTPILVVGGGRSHL
jgi:hypothetical protein